MTVCWNTKPAWPLSLPKCLAAQLNRSVDIDWTLFNEGKLRLFSNLLFFCFFPLDEILKRSCGGKAERKDLLNFLKCLDKPKLDRIKACGFGTRHVIHQLVDGNESRETFVPKLCCLALISEDCLRSRLANTNCEDPSVNPNNYTEIVLGPLQSSFMDPTCKDYKSMAACEAKIAEETAKMKAAVLSNTNLGIGDRSVLQPLIEAAERMVN